MFHHWNFCFFQQTNQSIDRTDSIPADTILIALQEPVTHVFLPDVLCNRGHFSFVEILFFR